MISVIKKCANLFLAGSIVLTMGAAMLPAHAVSAASGQLAVDPPAATGAPKGMTGAKSSIGTFSSQAGISTQGDLQSIVGKIIRGFLGLLGTVFVVLVLYAGYLWMTAQGNEEQITKAKKLITNATIGLIIIILAYAITNFVLNSLYTATTAGGGAPASP